MAIATFRCYMTLANLPHTPPIVESLHPVLPVPGQADPRYRVIELRAAGVAVFLAVTLLGVKFYVYYLTGSVAVFSDAAESVVNVVGSLLALWAVRMSHRPADAEHPYGHGKAEFFSAGAEGAMLTVAGGLVGVEAAIGLLGPHRAEMSWMAGSLLFLATLANGVAGFILLRLGRRSGSAALQADGWHLLADVVTSAVALSAMGIVHGTGWWWVDPVSAGLVGIYLVFLGSRIMRRSAGGLMDEQDADDDLLIRRLLDEEVGVVGAAGEGKICGYHKLRHRHTGRVHWVDFHVQVPPWLNVAESHEIASRLEHKIEKALVECDATAHIEPCEKADASAGSVGLTCPSCGRNQPLATTN